MNNDLDDNALSDMSEVDEDEAMTDDKAEQDLRTINGVIQGITNETRDEKTKAVSKFQEVITDAQYALDLAFAAGILSTLAGVARSDSVQYASKLKDDKYKEALENAKIWLKSTARKSVSWNRTTMNS